jgi:hypothetical protein
LKEVGSGEGWKRLIGVPHRYAMQLYVNITNTILVNAFSQSIIVS